MWGNVFKEIEQKREPTIILKGSKFIYTTESYRNQDQRKICVTLIKVQ